MPDIDEVLERLVTDQDFREALQRDRAAALAGYELTEDERAVLAAQLDTDAGESGHVEQRTSKSSTMALLSSMDGVQGLSGDPDRPIVLGSVPNPPAQAGADYHQVKMEDVLVSSYQTGDDGLADGLAVPDAGAEIQDGTSTTVLLSDSFGEQAPEDVVAPPGDPQAAAGKGQVEYQWKIEPGQKVEGAELGMTAGSVDDAAPTETLSLNFVEIKPKEASASGQNEKGFAEVGSPTQTSPSDLVAPEGSEKIGLLLPAVQKVRAAGDGTGDGIADVIVAPGTAGDLPGGVEIGALKAGDTSIDPGSQDLIDPSASEGQGAAKIDADTLQPQETDLEFVQSRAGGPSPYDGSHEIEMDVHVGKSEPEPIDNLAAPGDEPEELIFPAVQAARETPPPTGD